MHDCFARLKSASTCSRLCQSQWLRINRETYQGETRMKHASDIFPQALTRLIELGEKARKERETRERKAGDRETIRVKRKEKRARQALIQFN